MKKNFQTKKFRNIFLNQILFISVLVFLFFPINSFAITLVDAGSLSISATVGSGGSGGSSGGGGGGGSYNAPTSITFSGLAYPLSHVILLKDGQEVVNTVSGPDAHFTISISGLNSGTYTFSILGEDSNGIRSTLFTVPILITSGVATNISGIFLAPTIEINKQQVRRGETLTIFGRTAPNATVVIEVHSANEIFNTIPSDNNGAYLYNLNTMPLEYGSHNTKSKSSLPNTISNETSSYSKTLTFAVGDTTIEKKEDCGTKSDLNNDCHVNLIDFSVLAYWYHRSGPPIGVDLNGDGIINLVDFSILAYHWNG
ncbi:MAG: hypothetical protein NT068_04130 [Candidatus Nomurabacteria bacterium]|nr:hypothetical protein [Candidatus Nomurabacteria bacterium]